MRLGGYQLLAAVALAVVVAGSASVAACGSEVSQEDPANGGSGGGGDIGEPSYVACMDKPETGDRCNGDPGCAFFTEDYDFHCNATCTVNGLWVVECKCNPYDGPECSPCNPPCPPTLPVGGTPCEIDLDVCSLYDCYYDELGCPGLGYSAVCYNGTWGFDECDSTGGQGGVGGSGGRGGSGG